ncbi:hypothetical protein KM427_14845 [Nocardioides sp. LMS-CY]|uniref:Heme exporter protein D n=1 Tax=Nocardioides soli TaxID=1036020 RepID=A0A7W4Z2W3_9ACTN|nr:MULTISPECIES: cellulose synthase [Nocardioides]MBB3044433.1 heme exporter protein D [Nocardioides soli]QWF20267.1 hypothetical protein KM427_14845 [Nocardioides sp. LMS-CY]
MDDAAWAALTLSLTVLGGIWTWAAFRRRGLTSGMRALGFTLLPLAAYLTKTLQMFTRIVDAVADWATRLVFSPTVWLGVIIGGVGVVLIVVSGMMRTRQLGQARPEKPQGGSTELPAGGASRKAPAIDTDPEMAEIEALLRKRGIN